MLPQEDTPPGLPPWDPAAELEDLELLEDLDTRAWVLVRYIGQPLGELIPLPLAGLDVGRAPGNGLCLPEPEVSRQHARLQASPDMETVELRDLGSTNGVYVNGLRVIANPRPVLLRAEDVIRFGNHVFKLKHMDALERSYHLDMSARTMKDTLTGVTNRGTILAQLETQVELARRHGHPLCLVLADLDDLKALNDHHGHRVGDRALEAFGNLLRRRFRETDPTGRLGGDEFLVVLPETNILVAINAAEDFRQALCERPLELGEPQPIWLSCSIGVAELRAADGNGGDLLARADAALYEAKKGGRNRSLPAR